MASGKDFDDFLEGMAEETSADEAYQRHPVGKFPGVVTDITKKQVKGKTGEKSVWEFNVSTSEGNATWTLWGWSPEEMASAQTNEEEAKRMRASIARYKRLYEDLGFDPPKSWSRGDDSIIGRLHELLNAPCTLVVQPDRRDATKTVAFINAPEGAEAARGPSGPSIGSAPPDLDSPTTGPSTPGLDDIPF